MEVSLNCLITWQLFGAVFAQLIPQAIYLLFWMFVFYNCHPPRPNLALVFLSGLLGGVKIKTAAKHCEWETSTHPTGAAGGLHRSDRRLLQG